MIYFGKIRHRMVQNNIPKSENGTEWHRIGTEWHRIIYIDIYKAQNGTKQCPKESEWHKNAQYAQNGI